MEKKLEDPIAIMGALLKEINEAKKLKEKTFFKRTNPPIAFQYCRRLLYHIAKICALHGPPALALATTLRVDGQRHRRHQGTSASHLLKKG